MSPGVPLQCVANANVAGARDAGLSLREETDFKLNCSEYAGDIAYRRMNPVFRSAQVATSTVFMSRDPLKIRVLVENVRELMERSPCA